MLRIVVVLTLWLSMAMADTGARADLVLREIDVPDVIALGDTDPVMFRYGNLTDVTASGVVLSLFYSDDNVWDDADPLLCRVFRITMGAVPNRWLETSCTWPLDIPPGRGVLLAVLDSDEVVEEPDELNNIRGQALTVEPAHGPDLAFEEVDPVWFTDEGQVALWYRVVNKGTMTAVASQTEIRLSPDAILDPTDAVLCVDEVPMLPAEAEAERSLQCALPEGMEAGSWWLFFTLDHADVVDERWESDNEGVVSMRVSPTADETPPTDVGAQPAEDVPPEPEVSPAVVSACGCQAGSGGGWVVWVGLLGVVRRRRGGGIEEGATGLPLLRSP